MTLKGVLRDDHDELSLGVARLVTSQKHDARCRAMIYHDPSTLHKGRYTIKGTLRILSYVLHAALLDPLVQKHGVITLIDMPHIKWHHFDRRLMHSIMAALKGAFPVRISAFFIAHPLPYLSVILLYSQGCHERTSERTHVQTHCING
jgi:hypothetical protein